MNFVSNWPLSLDLRSDTDTGLSFGQRPERSRVRQHAFEKLERSDFLAFEFDGLDRRHTNILQYLKMGDVLVGKCHPEPNPLQSRQILGQALQLFMVEEVDFTRSNFRIGKVEIATNRKGRDFLPLALFPVPPISGYFSDIDFRIEIGRGEPVVGVGINNVYLGDFIEPVFQSVSKIRWSRRGRTPSLGWQSTQPPEIYPDRPIATCTRSAAFPEARSWPYQVVHSRFQTCIHKR